MTLSRALRLFLCAAALFAVDFFTKSYVHNNLPLIYYAERVYPYGGIPVFQNFFGVNFSITHAMNKGAAWGMFAGYQHLLVYFRMAVIGGLLINFLFFNKVRFRDFPLMLIIVGALGNVVDYFVYGQVVDMFYFTFGSYSYPIFNVADSAIFCGVAALVLKSLWDKWFPKSATGTSF